MSDNSDVEVISVKPLVSPKRPGSQTLSPSGNPVVSSSDTVVKRDDFTNTLPLVIARDIADAVAAGERGIEEPRIETPQQMGRFLKNQGVAFVPREREMMIPILDEEQLKPIFREYVPMVVDSISAFNNYLNSESITDTFDGDNNSREEWRRRMEQDRGKEFQKLFKQVYDGNQLRAKNQIGGVTANIQLMARYLVKQNGGEDTELSNYLYSLLKGILKSITGLEKDKIKPYDDLDVNGKLGVVREVEKSIHDIFWKLAGSGANVEQRMVT